MLKYLWSVLFFSIVLIGQLSAADNKSKKIRLQQKSFITCNLHGQLGHQLYQIATTLAYAWDHGAEPIFPELNKKIFNIPMNRERIFFRLSASPLPRPISNTFEYYAHGEKKDIPVRPDQILIGYFQSLEYFDHHREKILHTLAPSIKELERIKKKHAMVLKHPLTVAVHASKKFVGRDYYEKAINKFPPQALFVVFSDDINWCRQHFKTFKRPIIFIEGQDHIEDFFLMSMLKHTIISNSSFSWWAAYLNKNPNKIVVAPDTKNLNQYEKFDKNKRPHANNFIIMKGRKTGMFHAFDGICNAIKCYEAGDCQGIEVDFGENGLYYEPNHGKNWWSYYCEPIKFGKKNNVKTVVSAGSYVTFGKKSPALRKEVFNVIQKYFHIKDSIKTKVDTFEKENFKNNFVISVHYRGTDKIAESPHVSYEKVPEEILKVMKMYGSKKYKIFVATDEQAFLDYIKTLFGDIVCYNKDALRSTNGKPVHLDKNFSRYKCGEDALVDCILLSRGNFLIRSSSNLSRWSTYFNPEIPVIELNVRYNGRSLLYTNNLMS